VDQRLALGALEGPDADLQPLAELVDHLVRPMRIEKPHDRREHVLVQRPDGERRREHQQPGRDRDAFVHRARLS
jgi:hypothetical protein